MYPSLILVKIPDRLDCFLWHIGCWTFVTQQNFRDTIVSQEILLIFNVIVVRNNSITENGDMYSEFN